MNDISATICTIVFCGLCLGLYTWFDCTAHGCLKHGMDEKMLFDSEKLVFAVLSLHRTVATILPLVPAPAANSIDFGLPSPSIYVIFPFPLTPSGRSVILT